MHHPLTAITVLRPWRRLALWLTAALAVVAPSSSEAQGGGGSRSGIVTAVWDGTGDPARPQLTLVERSGAATPLLVSADVLAAAGGVQRVDRQEVTVDVQSGGSDGDAVRATAIRLVRPAARTALGMAPSAAEGPVGPLTVAPLPFITLLCRFADSPTLPSRDRVVQTYAATYPGARHFFAEQAFGADVVAGSTVAPDWVTIGARSVYVPSPQNFNYYAAGNDCAAAAEAAGLSLSSYYGINFQFSGELSIRSSYPYDPLSLGGSIVRSSGGSPARAYGATWLSSVHAGNYVVVAHEMGHAMGWPHSEFVAGQQYDSRWDVMSYGYIGSDPSFGSVPSGTIATNKLTRGWITGGAYVDPPLGGVRTAVLRPLSRNWPSAVDTSAYVARIQTVGFGCTYTVEARSAVGYDRFLPGDGVIVHQLCGGNPRLVTPPGGSGSSGSQWRPGTTFADSIGGAYARVDSATAAGHAVTVTWGWPLAVRVVAADDAGGTVTVGSVTCGLRCDVAASARGQVLSASANPGPGAMFVGWTGACTGTGTGCTVTMNGHREVSARFAPVVAITSGGERRAAVAGSAYSDTLRASGGTGEYRWDVTSGELPAGLVLDAATGVISGRASAAGTAAFAVTARSLLSSATVAFTLRVIRETIIVSDSSRPGGVRGLAYADTLRVDGEPGSARWAIVAGALPEGLALDPATGEIAGTPATAGAARFTAAGTLSGTTVTRAFVLRIRRPTVVLSDATRGAALVGVAYADTLRADAEPGAALTWSVSDGRLPDGLVLDAASGVVSGVPTTVGDARFTATATAGGLSGSRAFSLAVARVMAIVSDTLRRRGVAGEPYADTVRTNAENGASTRWRIAAGALPSGLALDSATGVVSGSPTGAGTARFTLTAHAGEATASRGFTLPVLRRTTVAADSVRRTGVRGLAYADTLRADGEAVPVTWRVIGGALPDGVTLDEAAGVLRGTPTATGIARFTVRATSELNADTRALRVTIVDALRIASDSVRRGATVGEPYADTLRLGDDAATARWAVVGGALPAGLALAAETGVVRGLPERAGAYTFSVQTTGAVTDTRTFALTVVAPAVAAADVLDQLLGARTALVAERVAYLDLVGNRNGRLDVGDVRAWLVATGALPASAPIAAVVPALERAASTPPTPETPR